MKNTNLIKIGINKYQLPQTSSMKVKVVVYTTEKLLKEIQNDLSLKQLSEAASLPQLIPPVIGMPDIHQGFGLPIGGIMATKGLISVGAVGMDINCGVRLMTSSLKFDKNTFSHKRLTTLIKQTEKLIPAGLGQKHNKKINLDIKEIVEKGVKYLAKKGYALKADLQKIEENGCMPEADFKAISKKAVSRAQKQVGTLGSGNHFIEIQRIKKIFNKKIADKWGLFKDQICIMLHSGSRALGHQTCLDYTDKFWRLKDKYNLQIPRKGLTALPITTPEGKNYFQAMSGAVNFAFCNRAMMAYFIRRIFKKKFKVELNLLYDLAHNIAKWEPFENSQGKPFDNKQILVHRKGATRALPAGHPQNPNIYRETGHPSLVPGSMGSSSYIMRGLSKNKETFYSINHGAGRVMSRTQAKKTITKKEFEKLMQNIVYNKPFKVIADEAPQAYKNIVEVIDTLVKAKLTEKIAQLEPLAVIKGD